MKKILAAVLCAGAVAALSGCTIPLVEPAEVTGFTTHAPVTEQDVRKAIITAATDLGFSVAKEEDQAVFVTYPTGPRAQKFGMTARVDYTATSYKVSYSDSYGLFAGNCPKSQAAAGTKCIHHNVRRWLGNLSKNIGAEIVRQ